MSAAPRRHAISIVGQGPRTAEGFKVLHWLEIVRADDEVALAVARDEQVAKFLAKHPDCSVVSLLIEPGFGSAGDAR